MAVTRADVAQRAGVSPAVVSYVMNPGSRPVSADARQRVEEAIQELGYRPNAVARALRRSSTMSLGLMVHDIANPAVSSLIREIEDIAFELGYVLFVGTIGRDRRREELYVRNYVDRQVDALIVVGAHHSDALHEVASRGVPVIVIDRIEPGRGLSSVICESRQSAAGAVRHLIEVHGHTRIACVCGPDGTDGSAEDRVDGWRDALDEAGLSQDGLLVRADAFTRAAGHLAGLEVLRRTEAPAIYVTTDVQAVGVVAAIREQGLLVPKDRALVCFDGSEVSERAFPGLTAVNADVPLIAQTAMRRLIAKLDKSATGETHDLTPTELNIRGSCGCGGPETSAELDGG